MPSTARTTPSSVPMYVWRSVTSRTFSTAVSATGATAATSVTGPEDVREAIADEAERDADDHDRDAGEGSEPPLRKDVVLPIRDHHAPLGRGRLGAEAEEAECCAEQDVSDRIDHCEDDHEGKDIRKDVAHHHPSSAVAECPRGQNVLLPFRDERVPARDPGVGDPARQPDRDEHVEDARPEHRDDRDHEHEEREREEEIDDTHHRRVDPAAEVAGEETDRGADDERHARRTEGDQQVDAAAVEDSREDVAPEGVGAEHMSG